MTTPNESLTPIPEEKRVFRVTVRGQFHELTDSARAYLTSSAAEHDVFLSKFTEEGTFTYSERVDFFNLRYEMKVAGVAAEETAKAQALKEADQFLKTMRIGFKGLRAAAMDMSAMWDNRSPSRS